MCIFAYHSTAGEVLVKDVKLGGAAAAAGVQVEIFKSHLYSELI